MTTDPRLPARGLLSPAIHGQLVELIVAAFSAEELRWLIGGLPNGQHLHAFLPGEHASRQATAEAAIALVQRHGVVGELFAALEEARPARVREIGQLKLLAERELQGDARTVWPLFPGMSLRRGRYELVAEIGGGGYGDVWKALDKQTNLAVALKFLRWKGIRADEDSRRRFFRGARTIADVHHPCIAQIVEPRCEEGGHDYYSMEHVEGITLREAVRSGRIRGEAIVPLLRRVGEGLSAAHAKKLIHRDIHPRNILVTPDGAPKVIDFDLVRDVRYPDTRTGAVGTWIYSAPEVFEAVDVDVRADVFSLAMTAVFAFSGRDVPPDRYNHADMQRLIRDGLTCEPPLRAALARGCEWNKEARYPTIQAFCDALAAFDRSAGAPRVTATPANLTADAAAAVPAAVATAAAGAQGGERSVRRDSLAHYVGASPS